MDAPKVAVGCIKWGTRFGPDYVNVLHRAVRANLARPFRFVCLTDQPDGLDPGVTALPFPDFNVPRAQWNKGSWPKLPLFAPGVFADDEIVLDLDLDVMVVGGLDPFIDLVHDQTEPVFYSLREWNPLLLRALPVALRPVRGTQGSVYVWRAGEQRHVFEHFTANTDLVRATYKSDRFYLPEIARGARFLPYDWCLSFKNHCLPQWPLNWLGAEPRLPQGARIIVFHGKPRPIDLMGPPGKRWGSKRRSGDAPVQWVKDYWTRYGGSLPKEDGR